MKKSTYLLLFSVIFIGSFVSKVIASEEYYITINAIESYIEENFSGYANKEYRKDLEKVLNLKSNKTQKVILLKKTFPKAFVIVNNDDDDGDSIPNIRDTNPLIPNLVDKISWEISSPVIAWKISQQLTSEQKDIINQISNESDERISVKNEEVSFNSSRGANANANIHAQVSANPLTGFGLAGNKATLDLSGFVGCKRNSNNQEKDITTSATKNSSFNNKESYQKFSSIIDDCHLSFTINFKNNSNYDYFIRTKPIPILVDGKTVAQAYYINQEDRQILIPARRSMVPVQYKAKLNTTEAYKIINHISEDNISLQKSQVQIFKKGTDDDIIAKKDRIFEKTNKITLKNDGFSVEWRIAKLDDRKPVTLKKVFGAIEQASGYQKNQLIKIDENGNLKSFNNDKVILEIDNIIYDNPLTKIINNDTIIAITTKKQFDKNIKNLSKLYFNNSANGNFSDFIKINFSKQLINKTVKEKWNHALFLKSICLGEGIFFEKNESASFNLCLEAAENGKSLNQLSLGICYLEGSGTKTNKIKGIKWIKKSAKQENAFAQLTLAGCYFIGNGVESNIREAIKYIKKSAYNGYPLAQLSLGNCYSSGIGVTTNLVEAVKWYRKSAEQGNLNAQYSLGIYYKNGIGVSKNIKEAVKWYEKAAEQGQLNAQLELGYYFENTEDFVKAIKWYRKAAEQGNDFAQWNLGFFYENGKGISKDMAEAIKWYRKAAEQGNDFAQWNLGCCYENGKGISKNMIEAIKWYRKAAEQGNAVGQWELGRCYENGVGITKNKKEAIYWYKKSAETYNYKALICLSNNELEKAFENVLESIEINPNNPEYYWTASKIATKDKDYDLALSLLEKAVQNGFNEFDRVRAFPDSSEPLDTWRGLDIITPLLPASYICDVYFDDDIKIFNCNSYDLNNVNLKITVEYKENDKWEKTVFNDFIESLPAQETKLYEDKLNMHSDSICWLRVDFTSDQNRTTNITQVGYNYFDNKENKMSYDIRNKNAWNNKNSNDKEELETAYNAVKIAAIESKRQAPEILDTLAHLAYALGKEDKAANTEIEAIELLKRIAPKETLEKMLPDYEKALQMFLKKN